MAETRPAGPHAGHDTLLIAAFAAGDLLDDPRGRAEARALLEACEDCRLLALDLTAIASATRDLRATAAVRPRDFRLTPESAATARGRTLADRLAALLAGLGAGRRPIGAGLAALGVAALLVSGSVGPLGIGAGAALAPERAGSGTSSDAKGAGPVSLASPAAGGAPGPATSGGPVPAASPTGSSNYDQLAGGGSGAPGSAAPVASGDVRTAHGGSGGGEAQSATSPPSARDATTGEPAASGLAEVARAVVLVGAVVLIVVGLALVLLPTRRARR